MDKHVVWISARFLYRPALTSVHSFGGTFGLFGCMNAFRYVFYDNSGLASWLQSLSVSWEVLSLISRGLSKLCNFRDDQAVCSSTLGQMWAVQCGRFTSSSLALLLLLVVLFFFCSFHPFLFLSIKRPGQAGTDGFFSSDRHLLSSPRNFWTFCTAGTCDDFSCEHNIPVITQYTQGTD